MNEAIKPQRTALLKFAQEMRRETKRADDRNLGIDDQEADLSELATMPGWNALKGHINAIKAELKPTIDIKDGSDEELKTLGMRTLYYDLLCGQLDSIVEKVEGTHEAVKEERASRDTSGKHKVS